MTHGPVPIHGLGLGTTGQGDLLSEPQRGASFTVS